MTQKFAMAFFLFFFSVVYAEENDSWHRYDPETKIEKWVLAKGKEIESVYDACDKRIEWRDWTGTQKYSYDVSGNLKEVVTPDGRKTAYVFDARDHLRKIVYPSGQEVAYNYDVDGQLATVVFNRRTSIYRYDYKRHLLAQRCLPNGVTTDYQYDEERRLRDIIHRKADRSLIAHFHFEYDQMGNRILLKKKTPGGEVTTNYDYDPLYRLTDVHSSDGSFERYSYDMRGNRLTKETQNGLVTSEYGSENRLFRENDITYSYEKNLIRKTSGEKSSEYTFNELGQLVGFKDEKNEVEFAYNGQGERLYKRVNGIETTYSYEDVFPMFQVLEEEREGRTRQYIYGTQRLAYVEEGKVFYYLEDGPGGSVAYVVDEKGNVVEEHQFDAFGNDRNLSSAPFQYAGEPFDPETGLIFLRTRYYDPRSGRFVSPDFFPGTVTDSQSINRYAYAQNSPINFIDPMGTFPKPPQKRDRFEPVGWAIGVPAWQEGDPPPPEGMTIVIISVRNQGIFLHDPTKSGIFRNMRAWGGHVYIEIVNSQGAIRSISTHSEKSEIGWACTDDWHEYKHDRDVVRLKYLVPDSVAQNIYDTTFEFGQGDYCLFGHNCAQSVCKGAEAGGIDSLLQSPLPSFDGERFSWNFIAKNKPIELHRGIHNYIGARYNEGLRAAGENWVGPYVPEVVFTPSTSRPQLCSPSARGNFGGISLSKRAELKLNLSEIHGVVFDEKTHQLILIGRKEIRLPQMQLDDLAVAMQSVFGLNGLAPADPGVSIDPISDTEMQVRYFGQTRGTGFGKILFDGDYTLKMLFIGEYPCSVPGFSSLLEREQKRVNEAPFECARRTWIVPDEISLIASMDGSAMVFDQVRMRCLAESTCSGKMTPFVPHEDFARHFTENYDAIAGEYPIFSEVKRLGQITGVVKWLKDNNIPCDLSFFQMHHQPSVSSPDRIPLLRKEFIDIAGTPIRLGGGIDFSLGPTNFIETRDLSIGVFKSDVIDSRPDENTFEWSVDHVLSAEALPYLKTRKTGDYRQTFTDLEYPVPGDFPLVLNRFYDSFEEEDIGLGRGWMVAPFHLLIPGKVPTQEGPSIHPFLVVREGEQQWIYRLLGFDGAGHVWYAREDGHATVEEILGGDFVLYVQGGAKVVFDRSGKITRLVDRHQIGTDFVYEEGRLTQVRHQNGKSIAIHYQEDRITKVVGPRESVLYSFDDQKQLAKVSNGKGHVMMDYRYDPDLRLVKILNADKEVLFEGEYDDYNRLVRITSQEEVFQKNYSLSRQTASLLSPRGAEVEMDFNEEYRLIGSAVGDATIFKSTDRVEKYYDEAGKRGWEYTRDERDLVIEAKDPQGNIWRYSYNGGGDLIVREDPKGDVTCFEYDDAARLRRRLAHVRDLQLDEARRVVIFAQTDEDYATTYSYDDKGRISLVVKGGIATAFAHDENGLLKEITYPSGYKIERVLDEDFRLVSLSDQGGTFFKMDKEELVKK